MKSLKDDFDDFLKTDASGEIPSLKPYLLSKVEKELNPHSLYVFSKLFFIHALVAALSLLFCPQFGLQVFRHQPSLLDVFSVLGDYGCHIACGFFFMSSSLLVASVALSRDELRKIRENRILILSALTFVSLSFFLISSPEVVFGGIAVAWMIGAFLSSSFFLELGWELRKQKILN